MDVQTRGVGELHPKSGRTRGEKKYKEIVRYAGTGRNMGLDVLCFHTTDHFKGPWDNVRCKRYACDYSESIYVEIGKIIYYSFMVSIPADELLFRQRQRTRAELKKLLTIPSRTQEGE